MLQSLTLPEFIRLAKTAKRVAVCREILADCLTPISILETLGEKMQDGAILESGIRHEDAGRYSYIAFDSMAEFRCENNKIYQRIDDKITVSNAPAFSALRKLILELSCSNRQNKLDLLGGAVGFLTYDAVRLFEVLPNQHIPAISLPDMHFKFYRTNLIFDHQSQKLHISEMVEVGDNVEKAYHAAQDKINQLILHITTPATKNERDIVVKNAQNQTIRVDINDEYFIKLVEQAKEYIRQGEAFQVVLSRCFSRDYTVTPLAIYRALRRVSPSPYMFYLPVKNGVVIGASPEKFISVHNKQVVINPIAGTRQRLDTLNDAKLANELLNDKKERAEHMMLVDLARNDLGRVCQPGSVKISELLKIKHFSHVSHISSTITGKLHEELDAFDALVAAFPAGTLSGAPKIRAMEIIDELETSRRGMYGGAICRLDYSGNLDSCIAIRMAHLKDGTATVRAGAGIVYDSVASTEALETRLKAQAILDAISLAEGG